MSILALNNIYKNYGKDNNEVKALRSIDFQVEKGELIAIMGPSGCGKSTLLNILGCIDSPSKGEYFIDGNLIDFRKINSLSEIRNMKISFIFQNFALIKEVTVLENVMLPLKFRSMKYKDKLNAAKKYLAELDILELEKKYVDELSGGQQQRVAIARALTQETEIILADEPTGALDEENNIKIMKILRELNEKHGKTIIIVTHNSFVAGYCKRILHMKDGEWVKD